MENLRHLILWSLLPGHTVKTQAAGEPEDDLTPTPSVTSITSHPWDPGSPGQALTIGDNTQLLRPEEEEEDVALWSLAHLPPRTRNSGIWDSPELARNPAEEASSTGPAGNYKVVRKGKIRCVHCVHTCAGVEMSVAGRHLFSHLSPGSCVSRLALGPGGRRHVDVKRLWSQTGEAQSRSHFPSVI